MFLKLFLVLCFAVLSTLARNTFLEDCKNNLYKCCQDGKTEALGRGQRGCGVALCQDMGPRCAERKQRGECKLQTNTRDGQPNYRLLNNMRDNCAKTCGFCKRRSPAQPKRCLTSNHGCCWDNSPATSWDKAPGAGCPVCHDKRPALCHAFRQFCTIKAGPSARGFLRKNCQLTCRIC